MANAKIGWHSTAAWDVEEVGTGAAARRSAAVPSLPDALLESRDLEVHAAFQVKPTQAAMRRAEALAPLDFDVPIEGSEAYVVAVRHPSGAVTFHAPHEGRRRTASGRPARSGTACRFHIAIRSSSAGPAAHRGWLSKIIDVVVIKVVARAIDAVVDWALPKLAVAAEKAIWSLNDLEEGVLHVTPEGLASGDLQKKARLTASDLAGGRSLMMFHGTFSNTVGSYGSLARPEQEFFNRLQPIYGDRIFALNHFTVSRTPEENADALLEALPSSGSHEFDVITYSRGGLVLRSLTEQPDRFNGRARRFALGRAVLVASPNEGTPLASPTRYEDTFGWLANLLEMFPDNPFTLAGEWIAKAIVWIAKNVVGSLPGLAAMDTASATVDALRRPPHPPADAYSALVSNFAPDESIWQRMLDVGVDGFFGGANDLVVPSQGGWLVEDDSTPWIAPARIGCFGPGGNLRQDDPSYVHHLNFFTRRETSDFIVHALRGESQGLPVQDVSVQLPDARFWRSRGMAAALQAAPGRGATADGGLDVSGRVVSVAADAEPTADFHIIILPPHGHDPREQEEDDKKGDAQGKAGKSKAEKDRDKKEKIEGDDKVAQILAIYDNARVLEDFRTKGEKDGAGKRFYKIIKQHNGILDALDGKLGAKLPEADELTEFGKTLFETLFPGDVRRLYDVARSRQRDKRLNVILTSMIDWIADKPWEFAFDTSRRTYLATEEIHFVRNVLTTIPAERTPRGTGPLNMLVVVAQPIGTGALSSEEEERVIRRGFEPLINAGVADIEIIVDATPSLLHARLMTKSFEVVHFIGHGDYNEDTKQGELLFEGRSKRMHRVGVRELREILCNRGIQLVYLNACESGRGGRADFNRGVGPGLVAGGVPAVVANQYLVLDAAATEFSRYFYWALARGASLGSAAREARIAINYSIAGESIDWAVPVLYARDPEAGLRVAGPDTTVMDEARSHLGSVRTRSAQRRPVQVGIWDVGSSFPDLDQTVRRMNAAQDRFGFDIVEVSAPLGTWQRRQVEGKEGEFDAHLHAEEVSKRLAYAPEQLGVDYLFCITHYPMMSVDSEDPDPDPDTDLYLWWGYDGDPILLFSVAKLGLPVRGAISDRAIANQVVSGLAAVRADVEYAHDGGSSNCPLHAEDTASLEVAAAKASFDAQCRKRLSREIPDDFEPLEAILKAFHQ